MTSATARSNAAAKLAEREAAFLLENEWFIMLTTAQLEDRMPEREAMLAVKGATETKLESFYRSHL